MEELLPQIKRHADEKYLVAVADVNKDNFVSVLEENKITCAKAAFYKTVSSDIAEGKPFDYDMVVFFSPEGIISLKKNYPEFEQGEVAIAALGAKTAKAVEEAGWRLDVSAPNPQTPSITAAIDLFLRENKVNKK